MGEARGLKKNECHSEQDEDDAGKHRAHPCEEASNQADHGPRIEVLSQDLLGDDNMLRCQQGLQRHHLLVHASLIERQDLGKGVER